MSIKAQVWVHGTSAQAEHPVREKLLRGWGTHFLLFGRPGGSTMDNWIHLAISTPVILDNTRLQVIRIFFLHWAKDAWIRDIHLWDGSRQVEVLDGSFGATATNSQGRIVPAPTSDQRTIILPGMNEIILANPISLLAGVGLSLRVQSFTQAAEFLITACGAEFDI
jgi:hypothetical protein